MWCDPALFDSGRSSYPAIRSACSSIRDRQRRSEASDELGEELRNLDTTRLADVFRLYIPELEWSFNSSTPASKRLVVLAELSCVLQLICQCSSRCDNLFVIKRLRFPLVWPCYVHY
jgi:hypothetical protein